jgi:hypothetical protein
MFSRGPNFRRGAIFPRKFGPGGPKFGGAKFPGTPVNVKQQVRVLRIAIAMEEIRNPEDRQCIRYPGSRGLFLLFSLRRGRERKINLWLKAAIEPRQSVRIRVRS